MSRESRVSFAKRVVIPAPKIRVGQGVSIPLPEATNLADEMPVVLGTLVEAVPARIAVNVTSPFTHLGTTISSTELHFQPIHVGREDIDLWLLRSQVNISSQFVGLSRPDIFKRGYADRYWKKISAEPIEQKQERPKRKRRTSKSAPQETQHAEVSQESKSNENLMWEILFNILSPSPLLPNAAHISIPHELFPFQIPGIEFLLSNRTALLADDMGTGKTIMSVVAMRRLFQTASIRRVLIVCPLNVLFQWHEKIQEWAPELYAYTTLVRNSNREIRAQLWSRAAFVYLTTYETLSADVVGSKRGKSRSASSQNLLKNMPSFDLVIADEAHRISNRESNRFKSLSAVTRPTNQYRWALTGTPIQNSIDELVALFQFLRPDDKVLTSKTSAQDASRYIAPYFKRRTKQEVMKDLPDKIFQDEWIDLDEHQRKAYDNAEAEIQQTLLGLGGSASDFEFRAKINQSIQRLKQICNFAPGRFSSAKTELLKTHIEDITKTGSKVLVFSQYIDEGIDKLERVLRESGFGCVVVRGGQSDRGRQQAVADFRNLDHVQVLLGSVKAAGEGLNLVEANYVIHFDHWWTPAAMRQAEDRAHRAGQTKQVTVYSYWTLDTIDERIRAILKRKEALFGALFDGLSEESVTTALSREDWYEVFGMMVERLVPLSTAPEIPSSLPETQQPIKQSPSDLTVLEVRQHLYSLSPKEFEVRVSDLLKYRGYSNALVVGQSHDGGIDIQATDARGQVVAVQCKRYLTPVPVGVARDFLGAMNDKRAQIGILISTAEFTQECKAFCDRHRIQLIDGLALAAMFQRYGLKI